MKRNRTGVANGNRSRRAGPSRADQRADDILRQYVPQETPGVAVLVMKGDRPVLLRGYGNARIGDSNHQITTKKITENTVFDLGSLSKQFTALAILMLIDGTTRQGKYEGLSFRTRLSRFFPDLPGANRITIRNLLNHSSGLPDYLSLRIGGKRKFERYYNRELKATGDWYATMVGRSTYMKNEHVIELIAKQTKTDFPPGTKFSYSDTGYVVLAEIVRRMTQKSLGQFLKEEVFNPLRMKNTFVYDETNHGFTNHALCYRRSYRQAPTYKSIESNTIFNYVHGDGNVHSTARDLVKWLKAWNRIDDITDNRRKLISRNTFIKLFKPRLIGERRKYKYSCGFFVYRFRNNNVDSYALSHGGDWLGFHSYLMRGHVYLRRSSTTYQLSIVVLANYSVLSKYDGVDPHAIAQGLSQFYWDLDERYNILKLEYV